MWRFGTHFWHSHVTNPSKGPGILPDFWTALAPLATCTTNYLPLHLPHHLVLNSPKLKKKTGIAKWHSSQSQNIALVVFSTFSGFIILLIIGPLENGSLTGTQNPRQASCSVVLAMAKATFQAANFFGDECHGKSSGKHRLETHPRRFWWLLRAFI